MMATVVGISALPACSSLQPSMIRGVSQRKRAPNLLRTRFMGESLALAVSDEVAEQLLFVRADRGITYCRCNHYPKIAEKLTFGKKSVTAGASNHFMQGSQVARQRVDRCGFSKRIGHLSLGGGRGNGGLSQSCEAVGQSGTGQPVPEEENPESASEQAIPDSPIESPAESDPQVDWREFRAKLVVFESILPGDENGPSTDEKETDSVPLRPRWAHDIVAPEAGCVLIATEKIDGQQSFERSVILLLSPGSSNPREGPYGLILNRPLSCRIKDIRPKDRTLVKFFGNCQVHHGGPLDEDMFLLLHGTPGVKGYREVIPGVYYGAANGLEEIMKGNHLLDYRFFFGYSGWGVDQLKKEIDAGLWFVAACSTNLITSHSAADLWEEILLLMGGKYAELSRRPRRRHF